MKKLFALLLTVVMMASMMVPAMAEDLGDTPATSTGYEAVRPGIDGSTLTTIPHKLTLTDEKTDALMYTITYSFVADDPEIIDSQNNGKLDNETNAQHAVDGVPTLSKVEYTPTTEFKNSVATKEISIDWSGVDIYEPGIYRWTVTQSVTDTVPDHEKMYPSNIEDTFYLYAYVTDTGDGLHATFRWSKEADKETGEPSYGLTGTKDDSIQEQFPVDTLKLTLAKSVQGNQASKDQYFRFKIVLKAPASELTTSKVTLPITATQGHTYTNDVPTTAYHDSQKNPQKIELVPNGDYLTSGDVYVWLQNGQSIDITGLPYGTQYEITEDYNTGYKVTSSVTGDTNNVTSGENVSTVSDSSMIVDSTVSFQNRKDLQTPTGISLQSSVAFFGIVLAMGMMVLMFVGKRKEQN